jgi:hypothetical protein
VRNDPGFCVDQQILQSQRAIGFSSCFHVGLQESSFTYHII